MGFRPNRRTSRFLLGSGVVLVLAATNGPAVYDFASEKYHAYEIDQPEYKARNGQWQLVDVPEKYRINTIHAALLHTGKVLLIAGSGNNAKMFDAKTFRTVLWDPVKNTFENVETPADLFCAGHTQLPDGNLLVAGGTQRYESLKGDVEKAGGLMIVYNENPDKPKTLPAGTRFTGQETGKTFESQVSLVVPRAKKTTDPKTGKVKVTASSARVYVEATEKGEEHQTGAQDQYRISGLKGDEKKNVYGIAQKLSFDKKDFQGIKDAYEFDPVAEKYIKVDPMGEARWYPTLTTLEDGKVLSVSGLDEIGQVVPGKNEVYDPKTKKWRYLPKSRFFPTYPALFLADDGRLFYTGSNAGYGPDDRGREPGLWDLDSNEFTKVPGMSDPDVLETSMSVLLPPAQDQKYMVLGGGGVGESEKATDRTRLADLKAPDPRFVDGPKLYEKARYPTSVILPDDKVLTTNGSGDYRGKGDSNVLKASLYDPKSNKFESAAAPLVGRNYHSGGLLLPDGRVMTFGSDSLFADKANSKLATFEQSIELYTPPYLHQGGERPELRDPNGGRSSVRLGGKTKFSSKDAASIKRMRLMRPGAFTHVTNVEQRSVALDFERTEGGVEVTLPKNPALVPPGWYMVVAVDDRGVPSEAVWVHVPVSEDAPTRKTTAEIPAAAH
ncbi:radical copper oxidase GlxA [Streptomyces cavernicola]|uniref:Kelch motif-containing protein n=1 Tax=Streptomyces cavernicola TaxID=3043613 RepID=A0ABT6S6K6_9ACTN|nr:kelch motif-containing protein [Streptomyces sp. B-S-A6]MDI3403729.1 kelch motif-containing protein [Streptomyces sp. B-S-A6]